jgi:hypothetical protein
LSSLLDQQEIKQGGGGPGGGGPGGPGGRKFNNDNNDNRRSYDMMNNQGEWC